MSVTCTDRRSLEPCDRNVRLGQPRYLPGEGIHQIKEAAKDHLGVGTPGSPA